MSDDHNEEVADYQDDEGYYDEEGNTAPGETDGQQEVGADELNDSVAEMDEELERLTKMQQQVENQISSASDKVDEMSMYVIFLTLHYCMVQLNVPHDHN